MANLKLKSLLDPRTLIHLGVCTLLLVTAAGAFSPIQGCPPGGGDGDRRVWVLGGA
mgnify:CR=1 FL=1